MKIIKRKLGRERAWGLCGSDGIIEIEKTLRGKKRINVIIHELLHHIDFEKKESQVNKDAKILTDTLWEEGYRQVDNRQF